MQNKKRADKKCFLSLSIKNVIAIKTNNTLIYSYFLKKPRGL